MIQNNVSHQEQRRVSDRIYTGNLKVPVQCEENPEGQNGCVIFENSSYRLFLSEGYVEDRGHQTSVHHETLRARVQCVENPATQNGYVIADSRSYRLSPDHRSSEHHDTLQNATSLGVPVQCEENPEGQNGCVIFENSSYRLFLSQGYVEDWEHQNSAHQETLRARVQYVENPATQNGYVIADSRSYRLSPDHQSSEHHDTLQNATSLGDHHMPYGLFEFAIDMQFLVVEDSGDEQMHIDLDFRHDK